MSRADRWRVLGFLLTFPAMLWYPVSRIVAFEAPPSMPKTYDFKVELRDPYDPVRGRHVRLTVPMTVRLPGREKPLDIYDARMYASLRRGKDGTAEIADLTPEPPASGDFIPVRYQGMSNDRKLHQATPLFDRFYLNEAAAPEAERLVAEALRSSGRVLVRVKVYSDGNTVVETILIDGRDLRELLRDSAR